MKVNKGIFMLGAFVSVVISMVLIQGCYYRKADLVYPQVSTCDTSNVKYSVEIKTILDANCNNSCHKTGVGMGGVILDTYTGVKSMVTFGLIPAVVLHSPGVSPMPKGRPKLGDCEITKISAWVNKGAPNN